MPSPGWYENPVEVGGPLRWWNGAQWTERTAPVGGTAQPAIGNGPAAASRAPMLSAPVAPVAPVAPAESAVPDIPASASNGHDPSLTDWFQSIPFPVISRD